MTKQCQLRTNKYSVTFKFFSVSVEGETYGSVDYIIELVIDSAPNNLTLTSRRFRYLAMDFDQFIEYLGIHCSKVIEQDTFNIIVRNLADETAYIFAPYSALFQARAGFGSPKSDEQYPTEFEFSLDFWVNLGQTSLGPFVGCMGTVDVKEVQSFIETLTETLSKDF